MSRLHLSRPPIFALAARIAQRSGIPTAKLYGHGKSDPVVHARQLAYEAAFLQHYSIGEISREFGKHHTTIMHGIRAVEKRRDMNGHAN